MNKLKLTFKGTPKEIYSTKKAAPKNSERREYDGCYVYVSDSTYDIAINRIKFASKHAEVNEQNYHYMQAAVLDLIEEDDAQFQLATLSFNEWHKYL